MDDLAAEAEEYLRLRPLAEQALQRWNQLIRQAVDELLEPFAGDVEARRTVAQAAAADLRKLAEGLDTFADP